MKIPLHPACRLLQYSKNGLLAVEKAAGILSHPNAQKDEKLSLLRLAYDPVIEAYQDTGRKWYLLNRLDAPTSGLLLLADNAAIAKAARKAFEEHTVRKSYHAVVKGFPRRNRETWRDCLITSRKGKALRTRVVRGKPNAELEIEVLERAPAPPARTLVRLHPMTGKTHQLRVQCAARHLPIIGDATYGEFSFNREFSRQGGPKRLFLHSSQIRLDFPFEGRKVAFSAESPLPEAFTIALQ